MFYRIRVDLAYPEDLNPKTILAFTKNLMPSAVVINSGQPNEERGSITLEKCYHDETPNQPCEIIENWQVSD